VTAGTSLPTSLDALIDDLRSPDPAVRDGGAYSALAALARDGKLDEHLAALGARGVDLLSDDEVQARSFGALLLALLVDRDNCTGRADDEAVRRWRDALIRWYVAEPETRGYDEQLGWLHAVAHGADALGELAASPRFARADLAGLLDALVRRALAPSDEPWLQNEDDRVAVAMMAVLRRDLLDGHEVSGAVDHLASAWRDAEGGPVGAQTDNTVRLARTLHLQLTLGVRAEPGAEVTHPAVRDDALHALGSALAELHWFYGSPA
jgi:hypothetical protein